MIAPLGILVLLLPASATTAASRENPIRKVVNLLQSLREEVEAEGRKEKELFDKFVCYCTTNTEKLTAAIDTGRSNIGDYEATMKELSGSNAALELEIKDLKEDLEENQKAIADATGVREKETEEYQSESAEMSTAIASLDKAIPAIEKGMAPADALMQVGLGGKANGAKLLAHAPSMEDHVVLAGLLQGGDAAVAGVVGSGQILGILQQMRDNFKEDLAASTKSEEESAKTYDELKSAKEKQIAALTSELREKVSRVSSQKAVLAETKENHEDATAALAADETYIAELKQSCKDKSAEFDQNTRDRNIEIQAIGEAVKILNEDSALDLFKKTVPQPMEPPSFVQVKDGKQTLRRLAEAMQRAAKVLPAGEFAGVQLVQLQLLQAEPDQFGPVKKMITDMVASLQKEQKDDSAQRDFCNKALPQSAVDKASIQQGMDDKSRSMDEMKTEVTSLEDKIKGMTAEIAELDAAVQASTEQRKEENAFHTQAMSESMMAMQLLNKAKDKLAAVYQAKEGEPALIEVRRSDSREDPDSQMNAMLGISFLQVDAVATSLLQQSIQALAVQAPTATPPETASYDKKTGAGMGIMALMSNLISDLKVEQQRAQSEEAAAQKNYEEGLKDSQASREATSKEVVAMQSQKAMLEEKIHEAKASHRTLEGEMSSMKQKIASLHEECDFIVANFELRQRARAQEVEAMQNAIAILSGANFGFAQKALRR